MVGPLSGSESFCWNMHSYCLGHSLVLIIVLSGCWLAFALCSGAGLVPSQHNVVDLFACHALWKGWYSVLFFRIYFRKYVILIKSQLKITFWKISLDNFYLLIQWSIFQCVHHFYLLTTHSNTPFRTFQQLEGNSIHLLESALSQKYIYSIGLSIVYTIDFYFQLMSNKLCTSVPIINNRLPYYFMASTEETEGTV